MNKDIEIEITFPLNNFDQVIKKLDKLDTSNKQIHFQKDTYYSPSNNDFLKQHPITDWLRIRETKDKSSINFKHWHNQGEKQAVSCDEFETVIENTDALKNIFKQLDIKEIIKVEKTRKAWLYKDVEIAIDDVKDLGYFIELEAKGDFKSIAEAEKHLFNVLDELEAKTGKQDYKGYPYLILEKAGYKFDK